MRQPLSTSLSAALLAASVLALPGTVRADQISLRSDLPDYEVTTLGQLPPAPADAVTECRTAPPQHPAGQAVAAAGWQVISESHLGRHALVSFAAESSPGERGSCAFARTNLGVFDGARLIGLFWSKSPESPLFGALQPDPGGAIDIYTTTFPAVPAAWLVQQGAEVVLQSRPEVLPGCKGRVQVPQLWLQPLGRMRAGLIALGWTPLSPLAADPISADLQAAGFPEAESCSGTGVNYCSYDYSAPGARLRLITVGELGEGYQPSVSDYELTCQEG